MKKSILVCLMAVLLVFAAGCGESKEVQQEPAEGTKTVKTEEAKEEVPAESPEAVPQEAESPAAEETQDTTGLLPEVYKVPLKKIYLNVPAWQELNYGYTQVFRNLEVNIDKYVAVTYMDDVVATTVEEAHEAAIAKFITNIDTHTYVNEMDNITYTNETVNGIDVYKYEGTFQSGDSYSDKSLYRDCYIIGYSFIYDGIPVTINGVLDDDKQNPEEIDELKQIVEAMMLTVRAEK